MTGERVRTWELTRDGRPLLPAPGALEGLRGLVAFMQSREAATSDEVFRATWAELGGVLDELLATVAEVGAHGLADANPADLERWDEAIRCVVTRLDELDTTGARP